MFRPPKPSKISAGKSTTFFTLPKYFLFPYLLKCFSGRLSALRYQSSPCSHRAIHYSRLAKIPVSHRTGGSSSNRSATAAPHGLWLRRAAVTIPAATGNIALLNGAPASFI